MLSKKMNKTIFVVLGLVIAGLSIGTSADAEQGIPESMYAQNQVIVKLSLGTDISDLNLGPEYIILDSEEWLNSYLLQVTGKTEEQAIQELSAKPGVVFSELNIIFQANFIPNDPLYEHQYGLKNIKCEDAWDIEQGGSEVIVSVVDTGIDYTHPDLIDNYKSMGSWNFIAHNPYPLDDCGHGTHCAGIIAGSMNNGIGIAGVANVKIIAMKVLNATGAGLLWGVCRGIIRSAIVGADIISMSWGAMIILRYPYLLDWSLNFSYNRGVVLVAATGNDNFYKSFFLPAGHPKVIAVGAVDADNIRAEFSNFGTDIVMAPGVDVLATMPTYPCYLTTTYEYNTTYDFLTGTSMACPFVSGIIALYLSRHGTNVKNSVVRQHLVETTTDIGMPGIDLYCGYGLVNASKFIQRTPDSQIAIGKISKTISDASILQALDFQREMQQQR